MDINILKEYESKGLLRSQNHPTFPISIWNYTEKVQFEGLWDIITESCRGLIIENETGKIVARPFKKFHNINTALRPETLIENLPKSTPRVTNKIDGSLGIMFYYAENWHVATRGSFVSEQSQWAEAWARKNINLNKLSPEFTYLFEIVYDSNRIVVKYDWEGLILLGIINREYGWENPFHEAHAGWVGLMAAHNILREDIFFENPIDIPKFYIEKSKTLDSNAEGWVLQYPNGLRIKIKGEEYKRLHRIVTDCSERRIWECFITGNGIDSFIQNVPDEFYDWVIKVSGKLIGDFVELQNKAAQAFCMACSIPTRKLQAEFLRLNHPDIQDLVFSLLDGKDINERVWKRLRPEHHKPFKNVESEVE